MPLYDYDCKRCFKRFEVKVPLDKIDKIIKCPKCKKPLEKVISSVYFRVK